MWVHSSTWMNLCMLLLFDLVFICDVYTEVEDPPAKNDPKDSIDRG